MEIKLRAIIVAMFYFEYFNLVIVLTGTTTPECSVCLCVCLCVCGCVCVSDCLINSPLRGLPADHGRPETLINGSI